MFCGARLLQPANFIVEPRSNIRYAVKRAIWRPHGVRLPLRRFSVLALQTPEDVGSQPSTSVRSQFTSSVGSPPTALQFSQWVLTQRHITLLSVIACAAAVSATWLFCSAIPTLLAFKRAAESLEKLMNVAREELPDTMAAIRLSGMEISDLTMELSDLGQEITQGVRSSTRVVRSAEERLRRLTNTKPAAPLQELARPSTKTEDPALARTARGVKEGVVKGRAMLHRFFTITRLSRLVFKYFRTQARQ